MPDNPASRKRSRVGGFTLVELMVTMAIMAVLASAMAYVMAGAQESAQIAKTKSLIARLHALVMQKYESYRYRRLPVAIPAGLTPRQAAQVRCDVIRQLMRLEMPDRWTDVLADPVPIQNPATGKKSIVMTRPTSSRGYLTFVNSVINSVGFVQHQTDYQGAKCLYLLVTMGLDDPEVLENFSTSDSADFDGSGCKVFLDGWGRPIRFLRWAPGFVSPIQPAGPPAGSTVRDYRMPDQTDPMGVYGSPTSGPTGAGNSFALYPLIYSAGADGNYDLVTEVGANNKVTSRAFDYASTIPPNDPFASLADKSHFPDGGIGAPAIFPESDRGTRSLGDSDNIHNHAMGQR